MLPRPVFDDEFVSALTHGAGAVASLAGAAANREAEIAAGASVADGANSVPTSSSPSISRTWLSCSSSRPVIASDDRSRVTESPGANGPSARGQNRPTAVLF